MSQDKDFLNYLVSIKSNFDEVYRERSSKLEKAIQHISENESPYTFIETISSEGIKDVSRVFDKRSNREMVFASLKEEKNTERYQYSIINDAWVTSQLEHPNIPPIYEVGFKDAKPYFTMKLMKGQTLKQVLDENRTAFKSKEKFYLNTVIDICNALAYAHSKGILHLDIKADNIYIDLYDEVMLFDWGCALDYPIENPDPSFDEIRSLLNSSRVSGSLRGTPDYMSPEQAVGDQDAYRPQTDVFLVGALLYNLITGKTLYHGASDQDALSRAEKTNFRDIKELNKKCHKRLRRIVEKALASNIENRYSSILQLRDDLKAYLQNERLSIETWNPVFEVSSYFKRRPALAVVAVFSLIVISVVSLFIAVFLQFSQQKTSSLNSVLSASNQKKEEFLKRLNSISSISDASYFDIVFEKDNLLHLDTLLTFQPNNADYWFDKGRALVGNFQFIDAKQCFENSMNLGGSLGNNYRQHRSRVMLGYIKDYTKNTDLKALKPSEALEIIAEVRDLKTQCLMFRSIYQHMNGKKKRGANFLELALKTLNQGKLDHYDYKSDGDIVEINLSKNTKLRNISPLFYFPATSIDLSDTSATDLYCLLSESLSQLDISNTKITDYTLLYRLPVKELKMEKNVVATFQLKTIPFIEELSIKHTQFNSRNANAFVALMSNLRSFKVNDHSLRIHDRFLTYSPKLESITVPSDSKYFLSPEKHPVQKIKLLKEDY